MTITTCHPVCNYLGSSGDHVLDEIPVSGGINDGHIVLGGLELHQSNIDCDSPLTLGLQLVQNPSVTEGSLAHLKTEELGLEGDSWESW